MLRDGSALIESSQRRKAARAAIKKLAVMPAAGQRRGQPPSPSKVRPRIVSETRRAILQPSGSPSCLAAASDGATVDFGFNVRLGRFWLQSAVSFETESEFQVSNETANVPTSGKNSVAFEHGFPSLDIVVGNLLFPRADSFELGTPTWVDRPVDQCQLKPKNFSFRLK